MLKVVSSFGSSGGGGVGAVTYKGTWNASANSPFLASGVGTQGDYYVVNIAGSTNLDGITDWQIGDWAIFNGSVWQKVDNTDAVSSVNGQVGTVVLTAANVNAVPSTATITAGTGLTGGGTLASNTTVSLANTAVTAGTYGGGTNAASFVVDAQGRLTSAANVSIPQGTVTNVATGTGLTGGPITSTGTISLANTAVSAGSYGNATSVASFTVDAQGRLTAASNATIAITNSQVSGLGTMSTQNANAVAITDGVVSAANVTATTSFFGNNYQATSSAGGTLKNSGGTPQMQWGSGGGNNLSLEVSTNINPANAAVSISPTGTGTVTINPVGGGSANLSNITGANVTVTANLYANLATSNSAAMPDPSLPLNPEGYLTVIINGAAKKIPYYGV